VLIVMCGCSGVSKPRRIGATVTSSDRVETISSYAERVLGQSFSDLPGDRIIARLEVCAPRNGQPLLVRVRDYQLVLSDGRHVSATTGAVAPRLPDGRVRSGGCVDGFLNWDAAADQHPTIVDARTKASWKPNCPKSTGATGACLDPARPVPTRAA
jgi:hypothetical protein